jgi:hypothetical protein
VLRLDPRPHRVDGLGARGQVSQPPDTTVAVRCGWVGTLL